jgi:hypothetical protein
MTSVNMPHDEATQVGALPLQPLDAQVRVALPFRVKLALHAYVAVEPKVVVAAVTVPFAGAESEPQSNGVWQLLPVKPFTQAQV